MSLPSSGQLKISNINIEEGKTPNTPNTRISIFSIPDIGSLFGDANGVIDKTAPHKISEFYGYTQLTVNLLINNFNIFDDDILINSVIGFSYTVLIGIFPVPGGIQLTAHHDGFSTAISVNISNPNNLSGHNVKLYKNGLLQECLNLNNGTSVYNFSAVTFVLGDECKIEAFDDGSC